MAERICTECGAPVTGRRGALVCSKTCSMRRAHRQRIADPVRWAAHLEQKNRNRSRPEFAGVCVVCAAEFTATTEAAKFCSRPCEWEWKKGRIDRRGLALQRQRFAARGRSRRRLFTCGPCVICRSGFVGLGGSHRTCSRECGQELDRRAQPWRHAGRRRVIFERDSYRCQLCGKKTRSDVPSLHPLEPTVDHIIPRSRGGSDEPANLQCAHRICNSLKSDGVWRDGEQLRLTG